MLEPATEADLYEVDPAQFTDARNALVKRLRAEGQRDAAGRVAKLRRPPVTAWALNQVARHRPEVLQAVLETGDRLRQAMTNAVGGDASGLRDTQAAQRRAVDAAVTAAAGYLRDAGHPDSETAKQRMGATLGAAVVDDEVAGRLRDGVLEGDRSAPGFGLDATSVPATRPANPSGPKRRTGRSENKEEAEEPGEPAGPGEPGDAADQREALNAERERRRQERARQAELETRADRLARRAERLAKHAEEAERQAAEARQAAERQAAEARQAAEEARAGAARARAEADQARAEED